MLSEEYSAEFMRTDKEDLFAILDMRFGNVPENVRGRIEVLNDRDTIERLILVAANVPGWDVFLSELYADEGSFRLVGEQFNPLASETKE